MEIVLIGMCAAAMILCVVFATGTDQSFVGLLVLSHFAGANFACIVWWTVKLVKAAS